MMHELSDIVSGNIFTVEDTALYFPAGKDVAGDEIKRNVSQYVRFRNGVHIERRLFLLLYAGIRALFENVDEVTPSIFFGTLHTQFVGTMGSNVGWYIFQVKLELQARGLIKSKHLTQRRNTLVLITPAKKRTVKRSLQKAVSGQITENNQTTNALTDDVAQESIVPSSIQHGQISPSLHVARTFTKKSNGSDSILTPLLLYEAIKCEMCLLLERKKDGISLALFYELLTQRFAEQLGIDAGWYLHRVKRDLETKGLIKVEHLKKSGEMWSSVRILQKKQKR